MMYVILLSGVSLFGLVLLVLGVRGKCIDDHPLCRKCKYDLVGSIELPTNCPECGAELSKHRATRFGNRRRIRTMLIISALILLSSLTISGLLGWATYTNTDWNPYKPYWLLHLDAASSDPGAQTEMLNRLTKNELSKKQTQLLIKEGLDWQADRTNQWDPFWGEFIESAWQQGEVSHAQIKQYAKKIIQGNIEFIIRRKIRSGEYVRYSRRMSNLRSANKSVFQLWTLSDSMHFKDTDLQFEERWIALRSIDAKGWRSSGTGTSFNAPLGKYTLIVESSHNLVPKKKINQKKYGGSAGQQTEHMRSITITDWIERFEIPIEIVEPDVPVIELVDDPTLADAIIKAIEIRGLEIQLRSDGSKKGDLNILVHSLPIAIGFDVILRVKQKEWNIGGIAVSMYRKFGNLIPNWDANLDDFPTDVTAVDIVLRSNPKFGERKAGIDRIWKGEIIIPNQPLTQDELKK